MKTTPPAPHRGFGSDYLEFSDIEIHGESLADLKRRSSRYRAQALNICDKAMRARLKVVADGARDRPDNPCLTRVSALFKPAGAYFLWCLFGVYF
jgi:hypothetical protein